jgi:hypothetical protein
MHTERHIFPADVIAAAVDNNDYEGIRALAAR